MSNGFPLSAVVGREDIMMVAAPTTGKISYSGTFNGYQIALAAAEATITEIIAEDVPQHLHRATNLLVQSFNKLSRDLGINALAQGLAGQFQNYFTDKPVYNYRDVLTVDDNLYRHFREGLLNNGIFYLPYKFFHHGITYSHRDAELKQIIHAYEVTLQQLRQIPQSTGLSSKPSL
jgi:glutamate-1-semialdehyde 2,1-aminomutase